MCGGRLALSEKIIVVWIDDDKTHKKEAGLIENKGHKIKISFFHPKEITISDTTADLFLIDDLLYQHENTNNEKSNKQGLTLAAEIRVTFPEIPIYIFTNDFYEEGIFGSLSQATEGLADEKIFYKVIQRDGANILYNDARDYKKIRACEKLNYTKLLNLLKPPKTAIEDLYNALPEVLKDGLHPIDDQKGAEGNSLYYGKWIKKTLLAYSGFVYDSLSAATSVGLQEKFFQNLNDFKPALYDGLFSKTRKPLWWKTELNRVLMKKAQKSLNIKEIGNPFAVAEKIYNLKNHQQPVCVVCGEKYPETVAYNKDDETDRQPVHFSCSCIDYTKENRLFFDEIRYFEYSDLKK